MRNFLTMLFLAFMTLTTSLAQQASTHPAYVSVMKTTAPLYGQPQTMAVCGGIVVDEKRKLIATALHCVPNDQNLVKTLTVNGGPVTLMNFSLDADMAIFKVTDLKGAKAPASAVAKVGKAVSAYAYFDGFNVGILGPSDHAYMPISIREVLSWKTTVVTSAYGEKREPPFFDKLVKTPFKWVVVAGNPTQGFSGGPMFDENGKFIGLISNGNNGFTNVSSSENVELLLKQIN